MNSIQTLYTCSQKHLANTKDDTHFHLERVEKQELVRRYVPNRIQAKRIDGLVGTIFGDRSCLRPFVHGSVFLVFENPTAPKEVQTQRKTIVVNQTSVDRIKSHKHEHVSHSVHRLHFLTLPLQTLFRLLFVPAHENSCQEQKHTVSNITVHYPKEEREGSRGKQGGISLSITGDTICVDKLLVCIRELVRHKVGWRSGPGLRDAIDVTRHSHVHVGVSRFDDRSEFVQVLGGNPSLSTKHAGNICLEHVERMVNRLLAEDNPRPSFSMPRNFATESITHILVFQKNCPRVHKVLRVFRQHAIDRRIVVHVGYGVAVSLECSANLLELGFDSLRFVEDYEYRLC
mmetsp:Transcript_18522/g.45890  ORF Transcript_18522/g.45890 Transcript_18522/m.45890 type:complete len:344 (-) Transcript_18522:886-1917(-)